MARLTAAAPRNAPGPLFVDDTCIACDACRRIAPGIPGGDEDGSPEAASPAVEAPARAMGSQGGRG